MIWMKALHEGKDFWGELDHWLEMIRGFLKKRYAQVAHSKCSTNPLAFTQGGLYKGTKQPEDSVGYDIVKSFTASFGVTALNELCVLMNGTYIEDCIPGFDTMPEDVLSYINEKIAKFREEDGYLYALYGTPAESLCGTQVQQFRQKYGVIDGVSDKEYFTNSFHIHVSANITPAQKQDLEEDSFHNCNGGHIQYVRIANPENHEAVKAIIKRGMSKGFYQGVNFDLAVCECCGHRTKNLEECDKCHSKDISVINRVCGYLGFSKVKGDTRMNDSKLAEIRDRKSM